MACILNWERPFYNRVSRRTLHLCNKVSSKGIYDVKVSKYAFINFGKLYYLKGIYLILCWLIDRSYKGIELSHRIYSFRKS